MFDEDEHAALQILFDEAPTDIESLAAAASSVASDAPPAPAPPPPRPKAAPAKTLGSNKKTKTMERLCRGCRRYFDSNGMATRQQFCHEDKRVLDNIGYLSRKQDKMDWFSRMKNEDEKRRTTLYTF